MTATGLEPTAKGLIEFVKDGFICKTIPEYTSDKIECICSEFTISKNKWICFSIYRPPVSTNLTIFFEELTKVLSKAVLKYVNIIPLDGTHLVAVRGLITKRYPPKCVGAALLRSIRTNRSSLICRCQGPEPR